MKIVFLSTFFNHHQSALSEALSKCCDYTYVSTGKIPQERIALGYGVAQYPDYVIDYEAAPERVHQLLQEADVVIAGAAPEQLVRPCIMRGQVVLRYYERPLKNGLEPLKYLPRLVRWHWRNPQTKKVYLLCASAFSAGDYAKFGLFRNRAFRWGYFPEVKVYPEFEKLLACKERNAILWAGRFLDWKHPDDALQVAQRLKSDGYDFTLSFIGIGEMEQTLKKRAKENDLLDCVRFLGSMKPEEVRQHMEQSQVFLFTSDRKEGWGAVANEAMNSACAVVASNEIGSVPYLIQDGENGLVYSSGNIDELYQKVRVLLENPEQAENLGRAAYHTMTTQWNAEIAAERLLVMAEQLLKGNNAWRGFRAGPCSRHRQKPFWG